MSDVANFKIYYGRWTIIEGPEGIDLRYFQSATVPLPRAEQRTWGAVMRWLFHSFELDHDVYDLRLSCLAPSNTTHILGVSAAEGNKVMAVICTHDEGGRV